MVRSQIRRSMLVLAVVGLLASAAAAPAAARVKDAELAAEAVEEGLAVEPLALPDGGQ